jgi:hypothetical protein
LNYRENHGAPVGSHKIAGCLAVNGNDATEVRTALWLFENLYFGWNCRTTEALRCRRGYTAQGVVIDSWGMTGLITDAAIAKYATTSANGALHTVVSQDGLNKAMQKAPAGFDWSQLVADFDSIGS